MVRHRPLRSVTLAGAVLAGGCFGGSAALAQVVVTPSATASVSAGYATNPFLERGSNTDSALLRFDLRPSVQITQDKTVASIDAYYSHSQYLSHYDGDDAVGVTLSGTTSLNSRLSLHTGIGFDSSIVGRGNLVSGIPFATGVTGIGAAPSDGVTSSLPTGTIGVLPPDVSAAGGDVGLVGLRQRRTAFSGSAGINYLPNARDQWSADLTGSLSRYPSSSNIGVEDYNTFGGNLAYSRTLSETRTVGIQGSATVVDYRGRGQSSRIYSPQLTFTQRLPHGWSVDAAVGASITDSDLAGQSSGVSVSGRAALCHAGPRTDVCLSVSRAPSVTGIGGVRAQTEVGASYNHRLDARSSVNASASYTNSGGRRSALFEQGDYWIGSVGYQRTLSERIALFASGDFQDFSGSQRSAKADVTGRLGLTASIGRRR